MLVLSMQLYIIKTTLPCIALKLDSLVHYKGVYFKISSSAHANQLFMNTYLDIGHRTRSIKQCNEKRQSN